VISEASAQQINCFEKLHCRGPDHADGMVLLGNNDKNVNRD
jgi:hypothetical protein